MNWKSAFSTGILAGLALSLLMTLERALGITGVDIETMWGSLVTQRLDALTWLLGLGMHLAVSGLIGLVYAFAFARLNLLPRPRTGALFGVAHFGLAGLALGLMARVHPFYPELLPSPGYFGAHYGVASIAGLLAAHVIYGGCFGGVYRPAAWKPRVIEIEEKKKRRAA